MKSMKLLFCIAFLTLLGTAGLRAQFVNGYYTSGLTHLYPASALTNISLYSAIIDVRRTKDVYIQACVSHSAAGTNVNYEFFTSSDALTWDTNSTRFHFSIPYTAGTSIVSTNFSVGGAGYLRMMYAGPNYDADDTVTNVWIKYSYVMER